MVWWSKKSRLIWVSFYGEVDNQGDLPTGLVSEIKDVHYCYRVIHSFIKENDLLKNKKITRSYVNYFSPKENANFHIDDNSGYTLLYYPNLEYDLNAFYNKYFDEIQNLIRSGLFDIVGHIDVIKKFNHIPEEGIEEYKTEVVIERKREEISKFDFKCVKTEEELNELISKLEKSNEFAFDLETTSHNPFIAEIVGISFSTEIKSAYYVPVGHKSGQGQALSLRKITLQKVIFQQVLSAYNHPTFRRQKTPVLFWSHFQLDP